MAATQCPTPSQPSSAPAAVDLGRPVCLQLQGTILFANPDVAFLCCSLFHSVPLLFRLPMMTSPFHDMSVTALV